MQIFNEQFTVEGFTFYFLVLTNKQPKKTIRAIIFFVEKTMNRLLEGSKKYFTQNNAVHNNNEKCRNCFRSNFQFGNSMPNSICLLCERILCDFCLTKCDSCQAAACFLCSRIRCKFYFIHKV